MKEYQGCLMTIFWGFVIVGLANLIKYFDEINAFKMIAISTLLYPIYIGSFLLLLGNAITILMLLGSLLKIDLSEILTRPRNEYILPLAYIGTIIAFVIDIVVYRVNGFSLMEFTLDLVLGGSWGPDDALTL